MGVIGAAETVVTFEEASLPEEPGRCNSSSLSSSSSSEGG